MESADRSHRCKGNASCHARLNEKVFNTCSNVWAISNTDKEIWTYEELDDIIYAFIKTANKVIQADCINGFIELKNKDGYRD